MPKRMVWLVFLEVLACGWQFAADPDTEVAPPAVPAIEEVEQSVEDVHDLLRGGMLRPTRPWYDADAEGVRRLDLRLEKTPSWDLSWLSGFFTVLGWSALVLLLAGIAFLLIHVYLRRERRQSDADEALIVDDRGSNVDRVEALPFRVARQATDPLSEARRQYEQGSYSEAIVYLFSHQLLVLDKQHIIHLARGKTNRQLVREIGPRRELKLLVEQTMVAFEDVFFGDHPLSRARFEACWFELERFDRLAQEGAL